MASNGVSFKELWGAVAKDSVFTEVYSSLATYIKEIHNSSLKDKFAGFFLFDSKDATKNMKVKINSGYTAKLVAITASIHSGSNIKGVTVSSIT